MYLRPRNHQHLPQIPQRWVVVSLLLSVLALSAYLVSWATADFQKRRWLDIYDEYSCKRPPFSIWRLFSRLEHLEQENHHTFVSAPGSNVMMVQHCVYPTKRMLMPLGTHRAYASRHGYAYTARTGLSNPARNLKKDPYWEKVYLAQQIIEEQWTLPLEDRVEWIVWSDADTLILNPTISLETFLPPKEDRDTHFLISRDSWGINFGVFAIRPTQEAWDFLWEILWLEEQLPKHLLPMREQSAMQLLMPRDGVRIIPKIWLNGWGSGDPFAVSDNNPLGSGSPACLQAHFAGFDKILMGNYVEHYADPRFNETWELGRKHFETEAKEFWDRYAKPLCVNDSI